jgi:hypothetical protein
MGGGDQVTDDVHDFTPDEADPFEALLKRAEALKNGDDAGLEALAKTAIEAKLSLPRIDKLARTASKATKFALTAVRKVFDEVRGKLDRQKQAEKQADPSVAAAEEAARQAAAEAEKAAHEAERERLWQGCRDIATAPNLLNRMALLSRQVGVIGEVSAIKGSYIVVTSRLMRSDAISLLRRGAPSGGKNFLFAHVTELIPEESLIAVTGASATALVYFGGDEDSLKHKVILIAEAAAIAASSNGDEHPAAVLLRSLLSEGHIDRLVTITKSGEEPRAVRIRRNGPVAVLVTSARENIDAEMLTRLMVCDADESLAQTKAVIRQNWGQKWLTLVGDDEIKAWRDFQRWLEFDAPYDVVVPFGEAIYKAFVDLLEHTPTALQLRMRRDSGAFLTAVKSSAVIHRAQRQTDSQGRLIAELADYRHAWSAFNQSMASLYGVKVRPELVAVAKAAEAMGAELYDSTASHSALDNPSVKITIGMMRQALGINSNDVADNRIKEAIDAGVLRQDEDRKWSGRGSPRYFWLLRTSRALAASAQLGVFPAPSSVKKFLLGGGGSKSNGQEGKEGGDTAGHGQSRPSRPSYPSYPPSGDAQPPHADFSEANAPASPPSFPSYPLSGGGPPSPHKIFSSDAEPPATRPVVDEGDL